MANRAEILINTSRQKNQTNNGDIVLPLLLDLTIDYQGKEIFSGKIISEYFSSHPDLATVYLHSGDGTISFMLDQVIHAYREGRLSRLPVFVLTGGGSAETSKKNLPRQGIPTEIPPDYRKHFPPEHFQAFSYRPLELEFDGREKTQLLAYLFGPDYLSIKGTQFSKFFSKFSFLSPKTAYTFGAGALIPGVLLDRPNPTLSSYLQNGKHIAGNSNKTFVLLALGLPAIGASVELEAPIDPDKILLIRGDEKHPWISLVRTIALAATHKNGGDLAIAKGLIEKISVQSATFILDRKTRVLYSYDGEDVLSNDPTMVSVEEITVKRAEEEILFIIPR